ncbi:MAG: putative Holliday junction resolvase [Myxococcota bacterium]
MIGFSAKEDGVGRIMALDVGTKTIGVALTDPLRIMAHPVETVSRKGVRRDVERLVSLGTEKGVDQVVVGLPLELDGTEERSARLARQVGDAVGAATGWPVDFVDERYSSVDAERHLIRANVSRRRRKQVIDQVAAVLILEGWLRLQG